MHTAHILLVDDSHSVLEYHRKVIDGVLIHKQYYLADTLEKAWEIYRDRHDQLDAVIVNATMTSKSLSAMSIVEEIATNKKEGVFSGILAATSSKDGELYRFQMIEAGCDHEAANDRIAHEVATLLGVPRTL